MTSKINSNYIRQSDYDRRRFISDMLRTLKRCHDDVLGTLDDIRQHGMISGFGGFIYYDDICRFFERHEGAIMDVLYDLCDMTGETLMGMTARICPDCDSLDGLRSYWVWTACEEVAFALLMTVERE